eukprot:gene26937-33588_t
MSSAISLLNDANPKVVMLGFDCLQLLVSDYGEYYQPLINMSFETLITKFSDSKAPIRQKATDSMICLIGLMDLTSGFERLVAQLAHKNVRVREQMLFTISALHQSASTSSSPVHSAQLAQLRFMPALVVKISATLNDSQASVRQAAVENILDSNGVKDNHITSILDGAAADHSPGFNLDADFSAPPSSISTTRGLSSTTRNRVVLSERNGFDTEGFAATHLAGVTGRLSIPVTGVENNIVDDIASNSRDVFKKPASSRGGVANGLQTMMLPPSGSTGSTGGQRLSLTGKYGGNDELNIASTSSTDSPSGSPFSPSSFLSLLRDGLTCPVKNILSERDLAKEIANIAGGLANSTDWQARITALQAIQSVAQGNLMDFDISTVGQFVKTLQDAISDLRSVVCKEACRTVAILARELGSVFSPFAESFMSTLMKVCTVKIAVMSSAADRCVRILVALCVENRLLTSLLESCTAKAAVVRKLSLEYLSIACALWRYDFLERNMPTLKAVIRSGLTDADPGARKMSIVVFLTLHSRIQLQGLMEVFMEELEPAQQKHIHSELAIPSAEYSDLLKLSKNPQWLLESYDKPAGLGAGSGSNNSSTASLHAAPAVTAPVSNFQTRASSAIPTRPKPSTASMAPPVPAFYQPTPAAVEKSQPSLSSFVDSEDPMDIFASFGDRPHSSSAAMGGSRRMSLSSGPVRMTQPQKAVQQPLGEDEMLGAASKFVPTSSRRQSMAGFEHLSVRDSADKESHHSNHTKNETAEFIATLGGATIRSGPSRTLTAAPLAAPLAVDLTRVSYQVNELRATLGHSSSASGLSVSDSADNLLPPAVTSTTTTTRRPPAPSSALNTSTENLHILQEFDALLNATSASSGAVLSNRRASMGGLGGTSRLAEGPKRIIRPVVETPAVVEPVGFAPEPVVVVAPTPAKVTVVPAVHVPATPVVATEVAQTPVREATATATGRSVPVHVGPELSSTTRSAPVRAISRAGSSRDVAAVESTPSVSTRSASRSSAAVGVDGQVFVFSAETLRVMTEDSQWATRVKAFESINSRLN